MQNEERHGPNCQHFLRSIEGEVTLVAHGANGLALIRREKEGTYVSTVTTTVSSEAIIDQCLSPTFACSLVSQTWLESMRNGEG